MEKCVRNGVTITWEIDNVKYFLKKHGRFCSPSIFVDEMEGTKWRLELDYYAEKRVIVLVLRRKPGDNGPEVFELDHEISVTADNGKHLKETRNYSHVKGLSGPTVELFDDRLFHSFTIRCKMWPRFQYMSKNCHFVIQTPVKKGRSTFVGTVENFSGLSIGEKKKLKAVVSSKGEELMTVNLISYLLSNSFYEKSSLRIEVDFLRRIDPFFGFEVMFMDSSGNLIKTEKKIISKSRNSFGLPTTKEHLIENAALYLPGDTLSLHFEVTFYQADQYIISKTMESVASSSGVEKTITETFRVPKKSIKLCPECSRNSARSRVLLSENK